MRKLIGITSGLFGLSMIAAAQAQPQINEILFNPSGADDGKEALEIKWTASTSLNGYWFLSIDGDNDASSGQIDVRQDLSAYSTGANGLLLIRDAAGDYTPFPDFLTSRQVFNWTPDIENGCNTFVIVQGTPPAAGTLLDADHDGQIDTGALGAATVVDAVGWTDYTSSSLRDNYNYRCYATQLGGTEVIPIYGTTNPWNPGFISQMMRCYDAGGNTTGWIHGSQNTAHALSTDIDWSLIFSNTWATWPFNDHHMTFGTDNPLIDFSPIISGTLTQADYDPDINPATPLPLHRVQFEVRDSGGTLIKYQTCVIGKNGEFRLYTPNGPGVYQLSIKPDVPGTGPGSWQPASFSGTWTQPAARCTWLRKTIDVDCSAGNVSGVNVTCTNGDVNNDNVIDLGDFDQFAAAFGTAFGDAGFDANADLNGDQVVDLGDFDILSLGFGSEGDI